jgi:hypothetical protein
MSDGTKRVQAFWDEKCNPSGWNFVTTGLKNGDLYFFTTFLKLFRRTTSRSLPVHFFADTPGKFSILSLIAVHVDSIEYAPELADIKNEDIASWCAVTGRDLYGPGNLIRLHPYLFSRGQFQISLTMSTNGALYFIDLVKMCLRLPFSAAAVAPVISREAIAAAQQQFHDLALCESNTVVIFPYAQSLPFDAMKHLTAFAKHAIQSGLLVCSAVHGSELPVPGTKPISINFSTLIPFCEAAGYVVALRSGIGDMLSSARARKINLYFNDHLAFHDTPNAFGLGDCSTNMVLTGTERDEGVAEKMLASLVSEPYSLPEHFLPPMVRRYFDVTSCCGEEISFSAKVGIPAGRYWLFREAVLAEGWSTPEQWGVWSIGFRAILYTRMPAAFQDVTTDKVFLSVEIEYAVSEKHPTLKISVDINGVESIYSNTYPEKKRTILLQLNEMQKAVGLHRLIFDIDSPASAAEQSGGSSADTRLTGIGIRRCAYFSMPRSS